MLILPHLILAPHIIIRLYKGTLPHKPIQFAFAESSRKRLHWAASSLREQKTASLALWLYLEKLPDTKQADREAEDPVLRNQKAKRNPPLKSAQTSLCFVRNIYLLLTSLFGGLFPQLINRSCRRLNTNFHERMCQNWPRSTCLPSQRPFARNYHRVLHIISDKQPVRHRVCVRDRAWLTLRASPLSLSRLFTSGSSNDKSGGTVPFFEGLRPL